MSDLIKQQDAIDAIKALPIVEAMGVISTLPSAQRKAEWIEDGYQDYPCVCSYCGIRQDIKAKFLFSYCPNCGSRMVNEDEC